jgi:large subunit ribosomal protein L15
MLNNLNSPKTTKKGKRRGRGYGSNRGGHTVGRGMKGQKSRAGYSAPRPGFEGGQMPLSRRLPKLRGFKRGYFKSKVKNIPINLTQLDKLQVTKIDIKTLKESGLISESSKSLKIKILGNGEIKKKIEVIGIETSKSAREKIEKAGGKVTNS